MNRPEIEELLNKAKLSLKAAEKLLVDEFADFSVGRSYFSMFYSLEALLLTKGMTFSKHSAVISAFGREFVKSGEIDPRFHAFILEAFDLRNIGDYGAPHSVPLEKAKEMVVKAKDLLRTIREYIQGV